MQRFMRISFVLLLITACSGTEPPGNVDIMLKVDPAVSQAMKDSIVQIVFLVGEGSDEKVLYPKECSGCSDGTESCPESQKCLKFFTGCGFDPADKTFVPEIPFAQVPEGKTMNIISCGLDFSQTPVVAGEGSAKNSDGESASITLDTTLTPCTENLPPLCT